MKVKAHRKMKKPKQFRDLKKVDLTRPTFFFFNDDSEPHFSFLQCSLLLSGVKSMQRVLL